MSNIKVYNFGDYWQVQLGTNYANIIPIQDNGFLAKTHKQYRVDDKSGRTIATMLDHFQTAKSKAIKHLLNV